MNKKARFFACFLGGLSIILIGAGCGPAAPDTKAPAKPTLNAVSTPTYVTPQVISGGKEAGTYIKVNGVTVFGKDADGNDVPEQLTAEAWSYSLPLSEGSNQLIIVAEDKAGNESDAVSPAPIITYSATAPTVPDTTAPAVPTLHAVTSPTKLSSQTLSGTKEANSSVWLNGVQVVAIDANGTWSYNLTLMEGDNNLSLSSRDKAGNESAAVSGKIVRDSTAPVMPTLNTVSSPTRATPQVISGTKPADSSVYLNGTEIVALDSSTSWTYSLVLTSGDNTIALTTRDALGNESQAVLGLIVFDATAPALPVVNSPTTPTNLSFQTISGTKEANSSILIDNKEQVALNGSTSWVCSVSLAEGTNTFSVTSRDSAGNTSAAASVTIVRDSTIAVDQPAAPVLAAVTTPTGLTTQNISGTKPANTSIRLNGKTIVALDAATSWTYSNLALIEGNNNLMLTARNTAGTDSEVVTGLIVRDTIKPASPGLNAVATPTKTSPQTISGTKEANTSIKLGATEIVTMNANTTWTYNLTLALGANAISLTAVDAAGNESGATTGSITYDNDPPDNPTVDAVVSPTNVASQVLSGTKEANSSILIGGVERVAVNSATTWSCTVSLASGLNTFTITSKDAAGNTSAGSASASITLDNTAPAAPGLAAVTTPTSLTTQTISGTKEANTSIRLNGTEIVALDGNTTWSKTNLPLIEGNNPLSLTARDAAGNESPATAGLIVRDTVKPASPSLNTVVTPTNLTTQNISGTKEANSSVRLNGTQIVALDANTTWSSSLPLSSGANAISLSSVDGAGNESGATTGSIYYDNTAPADPTINAVASPTNVSTQLLTGNKEANSSILINGVERVPVNASTNWSYLASLVSGANGFTITSKDAAGNTCSGSPSASITLDTSAPTAPGLTAVTTPTNLTTQSISGTKEANSSVRLNGTQIVALDGNTTWGPVPVSLIEGNNPLSLTSRDQAGNESGVTTGLIVRDTVKPASPTLNTVTTPTNVTPQTISGTKEANTSVKLGATEIVALNSSTTWSYSLALSSGPNAISLSAVDAAGNESGATTGSINYDNTVPADPTVNAVASPTNVNTQLLTGNKEANSSILINGVERVPVNANTTWSYTVSLPSPTNNFTITSKDAAGNTCSGSASASITLDTTAPGAPGLAAVTTPTNLTTQNISGTKEANSSVRLNGTQIVALDANTTWGPVSVNLIEGNNVLLLTSRDQAGNESAPTNGLIVRDTVKPVSPSLNAVVTPTNVTPQTISGLKEANTSVKLGATEIVALNSNTTWSYSLPLSFGANAISLSAVDAAGNESGATTGSITYDNVVPADPTVNAVVSPTNVASQVLSGGKEANSSILIGGVERVPVNSSATWSYTVSLAAGGNNFTITSKDAAGNTSAGSASASITLDTTVPAAPGLSAVTTPTNLTTQSISGTKEANTSIRLNGTEIVGIDGNTTWSKPNLPLLEGNNELSLTARDAAGNESPATAGLIVRDTVKPASPSLNAVVTPTNVTPQTISGLKEANTSVKLGATEIVALNSNTTWSYSLPLSSGANAISLSSVDGAGNESGATTGSITYDNTLPADPTINAVVSPTNVSTQLLTGNKEANSSILINGVERVPVNASTNWSYLASLASGANGFTITSKDAAGNTCSGSASASISLDTSAPGAPVVSAPTLPFLTTFTLVNFTGTKDANTSVWLNGVQVVALDAGTGWGPVGVTMIEGNNQLVFTARDAAGNVSPALNGLVIRDTTAPSTPTLYPASITSPTQAIWITLSGTKEANSSIWAQIGAGADTERIAVNGGTTWNWPTLLASEGGNTFTITSKDGAGNVSGQNVVAIVRDRTAPAPCTFDAFAKTIINAPYQQLSGTKEAGTSVQVRVNGGSFSEKIPANPNSTWSYLIPLSEGFSDIEVVCQDPAGNRAVSTPALRTVEVDTFAPVTLTLDSTTSPTQSGSQLLTGTKDDNSVEVFVNGNSTTNSVGTWSYSLSLVEGYNPISLLARDDAGNETGGGIYGYIIKDTVPPMVPMVIYYQTPVNKTPQMLVGIKEAEALVSVNGADIPEYSSATTWVYRMPLSEGPNAVTTTSWDAAGNQSAVAGPYEIELDTVYPAAPTLGAVTSPTNQAVQLLSGTKDAGSSVWLNGYEVVPVSGSTTWSIGWPLSEGSNVLTSISSRDEAGNETAGTGVPQTIDLDTVAPDAPRLLYPLDEALIRESGSLFDWSDAADNAGGTGVDAYQFQIAYDGNFNVPFENAVIGESWFGWSGMGGGRWSWRARARDAAGNWGAWSNPWEVSLGRAPGDMNGDRTDDVIVGSPNYYVTGPPPTYPGRVYLYRGDNLAGTGMHWPNCLISNPNTINSGSNDGFGSAAALVGDLDGDGNSEAAVGAPNSDLKKIATFYSDAGSAYVIDWESCGAPTLALADATTQANENFGNAVAGAGDVNGDGYADLLVGAFGWDNGALTDYGRVYLYLGGAPMNSIADVTITGENQDDFFGFSVSGAGDVNDDGYADFIVGAPGWNGAYSVDVGRAYIFFGDSDPFNIGWANSVTLELWGFQTTFADGSAADMFGWSVSGGGDFNYDGYTDVIIGAPYANPGAGFTDAGIVMIAYGPSPSQGDPSTYSFLDESTCNVTQLAMDYFGTSVAYAGYARNTATGNADQIGDILVGSTWGDSHVPSDGRYEGEMILFEGGASGVDVNGRWVGRGFNTNDYYGASVSSAGDINGDGYQDFLAGAPDWSNATIKGMAQVVITYPGGATRGVSLNEGMMGGSLMNQFGASVGGAAR